MNMPSSMDALRQITMLLSGAQAAPEYETKVVYVAMARTMFADLNAQVSALGQAVTRAERELRTMGKKLCASTIVETVSP
jgi:hypothetical protein